MTETREVLKIYITESDIYQMDDAYAEELLERYSYSDAGGVYVCIMMDSCEPPPPLASERCGVVRGLCFAVGCMAAGAIARWIGL